jgi:hypothetical protein
MSDREHDIPFLNGEPPTLSLGTSFAVKSLIPFGFGFAALGLRGAMASCLTEMELYL